MSEPKKHHYVPVFYLKEWCSTDNKLEGFCLLYNKVIHKRYSPEEACNEIGLYSLEGMPEDKKQFIEKEYMGRSLDSKAAPIMKKLINCGNPLEESERTLKKSERINWARFLISLMLRNPEKVKKIKELSNQHLVESLRASPQEYQTIKASDDPPTLEEWAAENVPEIFNNFGLTVLTRVIDHPETISEIIQYGGYTRTLSSNVKLLTCDQPCIMLKNNTGVATLIALPISPNTLFFGTECKGTFANISAMSDNDLAEAINWSVVNAAKKWVYGIDNEHLDFIEKYFDKYPQSLPDPASPAEP